MRSPEARRRLGVRLRAARDLARMSQRDVAAELQISRQTVSNWESGRALPDALQVIHLAQTYGTPTDFMLLGIAVVPVAMIEAIPVGVCGPLDRARNTYRTMLQAMTAVGRDGGFAGLR